MSENQKKIEAAKKLALSGLYCDGGHHKQWYLDEILKVLTGDQYDAVCDKFSTYRHEPGIPA